MSAPNRLASVTLDEASIGRGTRDQEQERAIALYDLMEENVFAPRGLPGGPWALTIALQDQRLLFDVVCQQTGASAHHQLSLAPFKPILKDYFLVCETYFASIRSAAPAQIEALDSQRRVIHNEGATLLAERVADALEIDFDTARRLFTVVTSLHWRG